MLWSLVLGLLGCLAVRAANYTNPIRLTGPDPFIVWDNATCRYYFTGTVGPDLEITSAKTLDGLRGDPDRSVRYSNEEMMNLSTVWAPEVHNLNGTWYIYYALAQHPYALEIGENLTDDFNSSVPSQLSSDWGIDGTVLIVNSTYYFVWSCHRIIVGSGSNKTEQSLCIAPFSDPLTLDNSTIGVISQPTLDWEVHGFPVNE